MKCFKYYEELTNYQAFIWLWTNDPEAKWFWLFYWLKSFFSDEPLHGAVGDNIASFGIPPQEGIHLVYTDLYDLQEQYEE